jgi:hypothetical protein
MLAINVILMGRSKFLERRVESGDVYHSSPSNMRNAIYYALKAISVLGAIVVLSTSAFFWIGTRETWNEQVQKQFWEFWFSRFAFSLFVGVVFFLLSQFVDWVFRDVAVRSRKRMATELLLVVILTFALVTIPFCLM